jgi:hypothetical protein
MVLGMGCGTGTHSIIPGYIAQAYLDLFFVWFGIACEGY